MTGVFNRWSFRNWTSYGGPHTIDRFANQFNTQLIRFNSRWWCPDTEWVDSFTCNWGAEINWVCPPPYLVPRVIRHTARTHVRGTLEFPRWPSAPYWSMIYPNGLLLSLTLGYWNLLANQFYPADQATSSPIVQLWYASHSVLFCGPIRLQCHQWASTDRYAVSV